MVKGLYAHIGVLKALFTNTALQKAAVTNTESEPFLSIPNYELVASTGSS